MGAHFLLLLTLLVAVFPSPTSQGPTGCLLHRRHWPYQIPPWRVVGRPRPRPRPQTIIGSNIENGENFDSQDLIYGLNQDNHRQFGPFRWPKISWPKIPWPKGWPRPKPKPKPKPTGGLGGGLGGGRGGTIVTGGTGGRGGGVLGGQIVRLKQWWKNKKVKNGRKKEGDVKTERGIVHEILTQVVVQVASQEIVRVLREWYVPQTGERIGSDYVNTMNPDPRYPVQGDVGTVDDDVDEVYSDHITQYFIKSKHNKDHFEENGGVQFY